MERFEPDIITLEIHSIIHNHHGRINLFLSHFRRNHLLSSLHTQTTSAHQLAKPLETIQIYPLHEYRDGDILDFYSFDRQTSDMVITSLKTMKCRTRTTPSSPTPLELDFHLLRIDNELLQVIKFFQFWEAVQQKIQNFQYNSLNDARPKTNGKWQMKMFACSVSYLLKNYSRTASFCSLLGFQYFK